MADNTKVPVASTGDNIRDLDRGGLGVKTQVVQIDIGGAASESLVSPTNGVPVVGVAGAVAVPVSATALPLPALAATSTLQTPANASLASLDSKLPALGQALAGASVPVVLTAAQVTLIAPGAGAAQDGTDGTGIAQTTGGVGIRGWLSGIYKTLIGVLSTTIADGATPSQKATVQPFHNGDNQTVGGTANGILTGGVAQLINIAQNLDRQRETGTDSIPAVGISTGAAQNASPFNTTHAASTAIGNAVVFTPAAMSGFSSGAPWSIQVGSVLVLEPTPINGPVPANQEAVVVAAVSATTFTAKTAKTHTGSFGVLGFVYNQSRDGTVADGSAGQGFAAGSTYLYNSVLNTGAGGWERERSAAGELDGATGSGTAIAAEYEYNGGGPGGGNYDRARSLQGKLKNGSTITSGGTVAGVNSLVLGAVTGLQAGEQVWIDRNTAQSECVYVSPTYAGGTTVTFTSNTVLTHANGATVEWDDFSPNGPGLNGFTATGIGIEEEALYNPVDGLYYIERASTQDAMPAANIVAESGVVFNGATFDRERAATGDGLPTTGIPAEAEMLWNGTGFDRARGDTTSGAYVQAKASPNGGYTPGHLISAATTNAASIKATAGTLGYIVAGNTNAAARFLKLYNKASAPTVGTDIPVQTFIIPGGASGAGSNIMLPVQGAAFTLGIAFAITGLIADADTTVIGAGDVCLSYGYI